MNEIIESNKSNKLYVFLHFVEQKPFFEFSFVNIFLQFLQV